MMCEHASLCHVGDADLFQMHRVSWSGSNLVMEHTYPKYDYSDYDHLDQEEPHPKNLGFSHHLHPSLVMANEPSSGYNSSRYLQGGTLGSFAFSSLSPSVVSNGYADFNCPQEVREATAKTSPPSEEEQTDHYYADQATNVVALLW